MSVALKSIANGTFFAAHTSPGAAWTHGAYHAPPEARLQSARKDEDGGFGRVAVPADIMSAYFFRGA